MFRLFNLLVGGILYSHEDRAGLYDSVQGLLLGAIQLGSHSVPNASCHVVQTSRR